MLPARSPYAEAAEPLTASVKVTDEPIVAEAGDADSAAEVIPSVARGERENTAHRQANVETTATTKRKG
jgi:hypothetical protein